MTTFVEVALPLPLRRQFDYMLPAEIEDGQCKPGCRVRVPFGRRKLVGVVTAQKRSSVLPAQKIKPIDALLDDAPLLDDAIWALLHWASDYYHHPLGEVFDTAVPKRIAQGDPALLYETTAYRVNEQGKCALKEKKIKSPQQKALVNLLQASPLGLTEGEIQLCGISRRVIQNVYQKQWIETAQHDIQTWDAGQATVKEDRARLNEEQNALVESIQHTTHFQPFLIDGVTGSGKTEVYLQAIEKVLQRGQQALVLIPEIGLSPQTWQRFQQRFRAPVVLLHSQLPDQERAQAWLKARANAAAIVIGTRSAVFVPMPKLGIVVVDEEHDASFKQQSGMRYNARDLAIVRGKIHNIPVILGSATPSLETLRNAIHGDFQYCRLTQRATGAGLPHFHRVDLRRRRLSGGLAMPVINAIASHLQQGQQVLVFLNRRGYAPTLFCRHCGWIAQCQRCDARMTVHQSPKMLCCHHCSASRALDTRCQACQSQALVHLGYGTEQLEHVLQQQFPDYPLLRIDRDNVRNWSELQTKFGTAHRGEPLILLGTQMLAKGHHFPQVTLVVVVNADQGLMSADFRGTERMAQTLIQVSGRAGRSDRAGEVMVQTHQPEHPLLTTLIQQGYFKFAQSVLEERRSCQLPPYSYLAVFRAEAHREQWPQEFLASLRRRAVENQSSQLEILGPFPAPMARKAGLYRCQLILRSATRRALHQCLHRMISSIDTLKTAQKVRWHLDVDPYEI